MAQVPPTLLAQASACATGMKPALRAALGGGEVSAGVCVTIGNLNELISVGCVRFLVGLASVFMWGCMPCSWGIRGGIYTFT